MKEYIQSLTFGQIALHLLGAVAVNAYFVAMLWVLP